MEKKNRKKQLMKSNFNSDIYTLKNYLNEKITFSVTNRF